MTIVLAGFLALPGAQAGRADDDCVTDICPGKVLSGGEVYAWHAQKDTYGPTLAGSPGWKRYMSLIEREATRLGMVNLERNNFSYPRWHTTEWPDTSGWSLTVGGESIDVASYGANSGSTGPDGITAQPLLYTGQPRAQTEGRILVIHVRPTNLERTPADWLYAPPESDLSPGQPLEPTDTVYPDTVSQLFAASLDGAPSLPGPHYVRTIRNSGAAGAVMIFDMADERVRGLVSYPSPAIYDVPTLYLGRRAGTVLLEKMRGANRATLRLEAEISDSEAWQLAGFLPGRNYGSAEDEIILMISHTDGPSISQENGPLGLLGIMHYFSRIERDRRDKSLMLYLDSRHYIPGREASLPSLDIEQVLGPGGALAPDNGRIVASVHLEHLGQIEFREQDNEYQPTGRMETGAVYVTGYQPVIDIARQALIDNHPERHLLRSTDLPGVHCQSQGRWWGIGDKPRRIGVEVIASSISFMGGYWTTAAGLEALDTNQFITQMNTMTQITGHFMRGDAQALMARKADSPCGAANRRHSR